MAQLFSRPHPCPTSPQPVPGRGRNPAHSFEKVPIRLLVLGTRHSNLLWTSDDDEGNVHQHMLYVVYERQHTAINGDRQDRRRHGKLKMGIETAYKKEPARPHQTDVPA